jgi:hypothetical protein
MIMHAIQNTQATLDELAAALVEAKEAELSAKIARQGIEDQIIEIVGTKPEGTTKVRGERFELSTTGKITRTLDDAVVANLRDKVPGPLFDRLFSFSPKLNLREYRYVEANEADYFALVSQAVTSKPAKASVSVKGIK